MTFKDDKEAYGPRHRPFFPMCKPRLVGFKALSKQQRIIKSGIEISDERKTKKDKDELMKIVYGRTLPSLARFEDILKLRPIQPQTKITTNNRRGVKGIGPSSVKGKFFFYFSNLFPPADQMKYALL